MDLKPEYLPATEEARQRLVLLHGWGANREIWRPLVAEVRRWADVTLLDLPGCAPGAGAAGPALETLLTAILDAAPAEAVYVGWSLGGQLATELALRFPARVTGLVTLCSNPKFVATEGWPGMAPSEFEAFRGAFDDNPVSALRRFDGLQIQGAENPKALLRQLRGIRRAPADASLQAGLHWLSTLDQREPLAGISAPRLHLFAARDALVPPECAEALHETAGGEVETVAGSSHTLPLQAPATVGATILGYLQGNSLLLEVHHSRPMLDKADVAVSFSRAAKDYDSVAVLQREVGSRLLESLDATEAGPNRVLDLGCGTGYFLPELRRRFPGAQYIGLDIADGMVRYARDRHEGSPSWLVADAESLPLAADSIDLVFSSLAIQWCYRPDLLFAELARVLRPGGRCVFTSLGPETLKELRASWAAVDEHQHVNTFLPAVELCSVAEQTSGLQLNLRSERFVMRYSKVRELLTELKTLGAHNVNRGRPAGLTSRRVLQGMLDNYESWRDNGTLPATYDVLFGFVVKT